MVGMTYFVADFSGIDIISRMVGKRHEDLGV